MDYKIVRKDAFQVLVKSKTFRAETSGEDIPKFWTEYFSNGSQKLVPGEMGICEQEKTDSREFRYGIGCKFEQGGKIPAGFELWDVPAYTWAIFRCVGPMPKAIQDMWARIYSEWLPQAEFELISDYDIEHYTDGDNGSDDYVSEIWVPVKKK